MSNLSPASFPFTIGSGVLRKNTKKTQPVNLEDIPITCGIPTHTRPLDVDPLEIERRAEYDRRVAFDTRAELARREEIERRAEYDRRVAFDTRAELARREEYDRRLVYDRQNQIALCPIGDDEEWKAQENRFTQMEKIIETLTAMFMKPSQPHPASCPFTIGSEVRRKITKKTPQVNFKCLQTPGGIHTGQPADLDPPGNDGRRADKRGKNDKLTVRQIASALRRILRQITLDKLCSQPQAKKTHKDTDEDEGFGFLRANHEQLTVRKIVKVNRMLHPNPNPNPNGFGFERAPETELRERKILICSRGSVVERQDGLVFNDSTRITKGAEGKVMGMERKRLKTEKKIQRKRKGIERARQAWAQKLRDGIIQRQHKQVRTLARVLRTSDPKLRTQKIIFSVKDPGMNGHRLGDVMSLRSYESTKREKMELITLVTKRASKKGQDKRDNAIRMIDKNEMKDWWKRLTTSKRNLKRQYRKGSTDVYLLKRTIELEID
jgi:hypothetical protein